MSIKPIETRSIKQHPHKLIPSCVRCFKEAGFEALFELENTVVVQKYCSNCLPKAEF